MCVDTMAKSFVDVADPQKFPNELFGMIKRDFRDSFFFDQAERVLPMYTSGQGNKLSKEQFLGLFGRLFYVDPDAFGGFMQGTEFFDAIRVGARSVRIDIGKLRTLLPCFARRFDCFNFKSTMRGSREPEKAY